MILFAACAPETTQPAQVMALVRSPGGGGGAGGLYVPQQVSLDTVSDVVALKGSIGYLVGGARIVVDPADPLLRLNGGNLNDDQLAQVFIKGEGADPRASYIEKDGVLWPADFHTWNMVTSYFNFEQAFEYFQAIGVPGETLSEVRIYYFPSLVFTEDGPQEMRDNALYLSLVKSFLVLPFDKLQEAPLAINAEVVAHEYAHLVFHRLVYGNKALPDPLVRWAGGLGAPSPQVNLLKSFDEGLSDFHAFSASCRGAFGCDPRFLDSSFDDALATARDLSRRDTCMDDGLYNALHSQGGDFTRLGNHYALGTILASALYHAGASPQDWELISTSVVSAYPDLQSFIATNLNTPENFTLEAVLDLLMAHTSSIELRTRMCSQFLGRLRIERALLEHCPAQAVPTTDC